MDNCKTLEWESDIPLEQVSDDAKQIGYKLEWPSEEMVKECKEMLFEKDDKHIDYSKHITTDDDEHIDYSKHVITDAVKEHKDIVKEVVNEKKETYELIKTEIKNRIINIPAGDVQYTKAWLDVYSKCQEDILDLLERLEIFDIEEYKTKV